MNSYRNDIDGIRAIAVLSILIFHVNKAWLPGGFIGVDIFFVISGFLITSIIFRDMEAGRFSLKEFYLRRIKRILPAAMFYSLLILLVAFILYLPKDLLVVAKSALTSAIFISNVYFMRNVDYFSPQAEENPFLHTWSLAVEEQYYFIWPLLLLFGLKFVTSRKAQCFLLTCIAIISFTIATLMAMNPLQEKMAFYLMPTRFGELLIGSMLALYGRNIPLSTTTAKLTAWLSIITLAACFILFSENTLFPGVSALLVCLATAALIKSGEHANSNRSFVTNLLSHPLMGYIGKISFSLYLAHWPVLAFFRYVSQDYELSAANVVLALAITFLLAHLSWRFIETPFRQKRLSFNRALVSYYMAPAAILILVSLVSIQQAGLPERFSTDFRAFEVTESHVCADRQNPRCLAGNAETSPGALLVGDSHAAFYSTLFDSLGQTRDFSVEARSISGCAGVIHEEIIDTKAAMIRQCRALKAAFREKQADYEHIILAERWEARMKDERYESILSAELATLNNNGKTIWLLSQIPKYDCNITRDYFLSQHRALPGVCSDTAVDPEVAIANQTLRNIAGQFDNVRVLPVTDRLCNAAGCSPSADNQLLYSDDDHLSINGANYLADNIDAKPGDSWQSLITALKTAK